MEAFGITETANDHRMKMSPDKRNMYLVDATFLRIVVVDISCCSCVDDSWQETEHSNKRSSLYDIPGGLQLVLHSLTALAYTRNRAIYRCRYTRKLK